MTIKELISLETMARSLDASFGKNPPKNLVTIRLEWGKTLKVLLANKDAKLKERLLLDRMSGDSRKIRMLLEDGDVISITKREGDFEHAEYYKAVMGNRGIKLQTVAPPTANEDLNTFGFEEITGYGQSLVSRTYRQAVDTLLNNTGGPIGVTGYVGIGGVALSFIHTLPKTLALTSQTYVCLGRQYGIGGHGDEELSLQLTHLNSPLSSDLVAADLHPGEIALAIDVDTMTIRVLCKEEERPAVLAKLRAAGVYHHQQSQSYRLLLDYSNDIVSMGFEEPAVAIA